MTDRRATQQAESDRRASLHQLGRFLEDSNLTGDERSRMEATRAMLLAATATCVPPDRLALYLGYRVMVGTEWSARYGTITVADDGICWWYHPGFYDDYRAVSGRITDEGVVARIRAAVAAGSRTRGRYEVKA